LRRRAGSFFDLNFFMRGWGDNADGYSIEASIPLDLQ
jgi:hypothetical protein